MAYPRAQGWKSLFSLKPYMVQSRNNANLLENLNNDDFPILFEGLHCSYFLNHPNLAKRTKIVRMHNIEHHYYEALSKATKSLTEKVFFVIEALKLKKYEQNLIYANHILAISVNDENYLSAKYKQTHYLPVFQPYLSIESKQGRGEYLLYHGKLSVAENHKAALYLIQNVFSKINITCIIAGMKPLPELIAETRKYSNVKLIANPDESEISELIRNSHCCILPTFQSTGIKLKLLYSLFAGRFCIVNSCMANSSEFSEYCSVAENSNDFIREIHRVWNIEFDLEMIQKRFKLLKLYSPIENALALKAILYS